MAPCRYMLVRSRLMGAEAHYEQLQQLLNAPLDYWKAQTPLPVKPVDHAAFAADRITFSQLEIAAGITPAQLETLLVLMAARMPQVSVEFNVEGAPGDLAGLRLWYGKLEAARRGPDGSIAWIQLPHHSTLIGSK